MIKYGINVNVIVLGVVDGEYWDGVDVLFVKYEGLKFGEKKVVVGVVVFFGCMGIVDDLIGMVVFFVSKDVDYIVV